MHEYLKLDHTPVLIHQVPMCGTCRMRVQVTEDWDWMCPGCGTFWDVTEGTLYEVWSGETLQGRAISKEEAPGELARRAQTRSK